MRSAPIRGPSDFPRLAFVATLLDVRIGLPVEVIPDHHLRRASEVEIASIRESLEHREPVAGSLWYEVVPSEHPGSFRRSDDPADWRYFVIEVGPNYKSAVNAGIGEVEEAAQLTETPIECGFMFNTEGVRLVVGIGARNVLDTVPMAAIHGSIGVVDRGWLDEMRDLHRRIGETGAEYPDIARAIDSLNRLRGIERGTPLRVLGLFAIMESLITHDPHDKYDSLSHQIRSKMKLLGRRFRKRLSYEPIGNMPVETVWNKLYSVRSSIAHGGQLTFTGNLKVLTNLEVVERFSFSATRSVLQQALVEPELILDLREC